LALPGERWCDLIHRRERYHQQLERLSDPDREWTINDAITENLDLPELVRDYLSQLQAYELDPAFRVLQSLTVCDPTVGSGAFLFAALDVLEPLYSEVLERAEELRRAGNLVEEPVFLAEADEHPNKHYWLLKTICLHNLYGVDIMQEAPEIAKLRLFLKLAAQIDNVDHLEPLPDLDFNIKCGNLLVGIADASDARERLGGGRLDLGGELAAIEQLSTRLARLYDQFVAAQTGDVPVTGDLQQFAGQGRHDGGLSGSHTTSQTTQERHQAMRRHDGRLSGDHTAPAVQSEMGLASGGEPAPTTDAKQALADEFEAARERCEELLHSLRRESEPLEEWVESHQPFHWFVEFPSVWRSGGFDVIIGNPPYIKTKKVTAYRWVNYQTQKCPDLYAACMERAVSLLNEDGRIAIVVMYSICFGTKFGSVRRYLDASLKVRWVSSFALIPDRLFSASVGVRNSIVVGSVDDRDFSVIPQSSRIRRWTAEMRPQVFTKIQYSSMPKSLMTCTSTRQWPCLDDRTVGDALDRLVLASGSMASSILPKSDQHLGFKTTALYQLGVFVTEPPTVDPETHESVVTRSSRTGWLHFRSESERDLAMLALAGRWGYLWWLTYSDEFDVTRGTLQRSRVTSKGSLACAPRVTWNSKFY